MRFASYLTIWSNVLVAGPRGRIDRADLGPFLVVPLVWLGYTLVRGAFVDWYPYPFVDVEEHGYAVVALNSVGVTALMLALFGLASVVDRYQMRTR
ncbi:MAG TPA: Pr6Pr family membrane protein [Nocardioides sp.]|nr:Pr6Pr family membrane protein [Nocardioides sp.]